MKKFVALGIISFFVFMLTGCGGGGECYSYEETKFITVVLQCEEGAFHPDSSYMSMANMYLALQNTSMWAVYTNLANANGKYDYHILVSIEGNNYIITRSEPYEVGQEIIITEVTAYNTDSQLVKTEYK